MVIFCEDYSIRNVEEKDLPQLLEWRNSDRIRKNMLTQHIISWEEHKNWFKKISQYDKPLHFVVEYKNEMVGYCGINDYNPQNKSCTSGSYIGKVDNVPVDIALMCGYLLNVYIFERLGMKCVESDVILENKRVLKFNKMIGARVKENSKYILHTDYGDKETVTLVYEKNIVLSKLEGFLDVNVHDVNIQE